MPTINVKTTESRSVWKSPDGQREIFEVTFDVDGEPMKAKTFSSDIPVVGWEGAVETWEKEGRNGPETFVKQPPKEGGFQGGATSGSRPSTGGGKPSFDQFTMYLSYAKDLAVAMLEKGELDENKYAKVLDAVSAGGQTLYEGRPDAPKQEEKPAEKPKDDIVVEVTDETQVNLDTIDEIFKD